MPPHVCEGRAASGRCCAGERRAEDGVNSRPSTGPTMRALSLDTVQRAESGQPGLPLDDETIAAGAT